MTDRATWEARHTSGSPAGTPSPFVARHARTLAEPHPGLRALDLACGKGRHTELLTSLGFETVSVDFAMPALRQLLEAAPDARPVCAVAELLPLRPESFDLIVQTCFFERDLLPGLGYMLRTDGLLVVETFTVAQFQATGHPRREYCIEPGDLEQLAESSTRLFVIDSSYRDDGDPDHPRHLGAIAARRS